MGPTVEHLIIAHASYIDFTRERKFMTLGSPEGSAILQSTHLRSLDILVVGPSHMPEVDLELCEFLTDSTIHRPPPGIRTVRFVLQAVLGVEAPADEGTVGQPGDETTLWSCVKDAFAQLFARGHDSRFPSSASGADGGSRSAGTVSGHSLTPFDRISVGIWSECAVLAV
ncbi:hypothetical protein OH76DRAFT_1094676 [Lentinus brumalis]|uniref:Uncharacterized protein n=1 Tax=Lentinus brumalis TaxID=2498619 RepID=A0A371CW28_9APHY|nr:hypothetical protein OH76DRAFT_1094676 [Polyporus brumalis]